MKITWKAGTMLYPLPPVLVTVGDKDNVNVLTIAWTGILNSDPAMTYISVRPERYSYNIIKEKMEFVINLPTVEMLKAVDFCGVRSGAKINKIKEMELELEDGDKIYTPSLKISPINLECKVKSITHLGTHDMFMAEIVAVRINEELLDDKGFFRLDKADLLAYCHGFYYSLGKKLGKFGFSVEKKKSKKKNKKAIR